MTSMTSRRTTTCGLWGTPSDQEHRLLPHRSSPRVRAGIRRPKRFHCLGTRDGTLMDTTTAAYLASLPVQAAGIAPLARAYYREATTQGRHQEFLKHQGWEAVERHPVLRKEQFA